MSVAWTLYRVASPVAGWLAPAGRHFVPAEQRALWHERLGRVERDAADAWLHAASLGEAGAALPLLEALYEAAPAARLHLTATTLTGRERLAASGATTSLAPLDTPQATRRFLSRVRPRLLLLIETELWPQWLIEARVHSIPVVSVSARLSPSSLAGYGRLGAPMRRLAAELRGVLAQTEADAQRWRALGAAADRVRVVGNLKDDGLPRPAEDRAGVRAALDLDPARPLLVLGSVRPGEVTHLARAWAELPPRVRAAWQVTVLPRHAGTLDALRREATGADEWRWEARMGVLNSYYRAADVAFVGGSLESFGGHNPMEPAATGAAVIMGPHVESQRDAVAALDAAGGIRVEHSGAPLERALAELLEQPAMRERMGSAALAVAGRRRGASARVLEWLREEGLWPLDR